MTIVGEYEWFDTLIEERFNEEPVNEYVQCFDMAVCKKVSVSSF